MKQRKRKWFNLSGENNILDVLVAQRNYHEVQQEYLETMKGYAVSLVELEKACGIWDIRF